MAYYWGKTKGDTSAVSQAAWGQGGGGQARTGGQGASIDPVDPTDPFTPVGPCEGGYIQKRDAQGKLYRCDEGYKVVIDGKGVRWCCPTDDPGGKERNCIPAPNTGECPPEYPKRVVKEEGGFRKSYCCKERDPYDPSDPTDIGDGCEGGYKLAGNEVKSGGGKIWTDTIIKPEHGWYRDPQAQAHKIWHPQWGYQQLEDVYAYIQGKAGLTKNDAGVCRKGYEARNIDGETWCCPSDAGGGGGATGLGEWDFPGNISDLYAALMGRAQGMLDRPYGFSDEAMQAMFGRGFENLRGAQAGAREGTLQDLSRQGMMGTSAMPGQLRQQAWQTEGGISDLARDLFVTGEEKKKQDELAFTDMAQRLFGTGLGAEQLKESINAARRGEGDRALMLLLQLLGLFK